MQHAWFTKSRQHVGPYIVITTHVHASNTLHEQCIESCLLAQVYLIQACQQLLQTCLATHEGNLTRTSVACLIVCLCLLRWILAVLTQLN